MAAKKFKELKKGDVIFIIDPRDTIIKPLTVDSCYPDPVHWGFIQLDILWVEPNTVMSVVDKVPTIKFAKLPREESCVFVNINGSALTLIDTSEENLIAWKKKSLN